MRYILPILTLLALLVSCAKAPSHNQPITYDHPTPRQLGTLQSTKIGIEGQWKTKWLLFQNYTMCLDFDGDSLLGVEIDHRVGDRLGFEMSDCCFDIVIARADTCWWWGQLPNQVRSEISARKYTPQ